MAIVDRVIVDYDGTIDKHIGDAVMARRQVKTCR
jgi:hypothetical protein